MVKPIVFIVAKLGEKARIKISRKMQEKPLGNIIIFLLFLHPFLSIFLEFIFCSYSH